MKRYRNLFLQQTPLSRLNDSFQMFQNLSTRRKPEIGYWGLSVHGATTKNIAGKSWNSENNYQANPKTPSSSGTHTSQTTGVIMTIQYRTPDGTASAKIFKTTEAEAYDFITELKEGIPFPTLYCEGQVCAFSAKNINEVRAEKTDVGEVSESKGS